jgi:hypothetical protein
MVILLMVIKMVVLVLVVLHSINPVGLELSDKDLLVDQEA